MIIIHLILFVVGCIGTFLFEGIETGFVSMNPLKVAHQARQGSTVSKWALYLINHKERVVTLTLIGSNICIVIATIAFTDFISLLSSFFQFDLERLFSPESWILTPALVISCEMLPKSLYRIYSFQLTMRSVPLIYLLYWVAYPFLWCISFVSKISYKKNENSPSFFANVRKEMVLIAQEGSRIGTFPEYIVLFIDNVLKLNATTLGEMFHLNKKKEIVPQEMQILLPKKHIKVTHSVSEIKTSEYLTRNDEFLVYDEHGNSAVGWVSIIDIISEGKNALVGTIMKPLPELEKEQTVISCISNKTKLQSPFLRIKDSANNRGVIINRNDLLRIIFEN